VVGVVHAAAPIFREASMPDTATPPNGEPDEVSDDQSAPADEAAPDVPVFANRAERRAKGKGKSSALPQPPGKGGQFPGGRGTVQSQRQYGNRRTG
jgi:hypothetical protein